MHVAPTTETHHACNHSKLKLTRHATTHNSNSPCMQPLKTQTHQACNHPQLKLTMHAATHNTNSPCMQPLTPATHHAWYHPQLKLTMHATTHNSNSPCMQPLTTQTHHACNLTSSLPCNTLTQILNLELTGSQAPFPLPQLPPLGTRRNPATCHTTCPSFAQR